MKKKILISLLVLAIVLIARKMVIKYNTIDSQIMRITDELLPNGGSATINLSDYVTNFEWDSVSIYYGSGSSWKGDTEPVGIYYDPADFGIVFKNKGKVVKQNPSQSTLFGERFKMTYLVENGEREDKVNYITFLREDAIVEVRTGVGWDRKYSVIATVD